MIYPLDAHIFLNFVFSVEALAVVYKISDDLRLSPRGGPSVVLPFPSLMRIVRGMNVLPCRLPSFYV